MERLFPERWHILSGSWLKILATVSMLIDHTGAFLLEESPWAHTAVFGSVTWLALLRALGRTAFPIYGFLLTEGFLRTKSRAKYVLNLLIFALLSEIPWNLVHSGSIFYERQNVLFTLLFGVLGMWAMENFRGEPLSMTLSLVSLGLIATFARADYGVTGFGFLILLYLLRAQPIPRAIAGCCLLGSGWKAGLGFLPIALYNGKRGFIRGKFLKYAFYAIYPVHLLLIYWIMQ